MPSDVIFGHCIHCGKNSRRRGGENYWTCPHCGKRNPGPRMVRDLVGLQPQPAASAATGKPKTNGHATTIVSGKPVETPSPAAVKTPAAKPAKPASKAPAAPPAAPARSLSSRLWHG